ncbi:hypothetical protein [Granulicella mallensis]|uniref:DUF4139 domain-containing protein n=1 Tax=Granulicella mallensis (strain ATCC BAA-1857 / DSM 23137 / MP5ACTX8) TaxID=682795 RepID=G8NUH7_GRAMM|nr:hypothetical protein [Granulicella mallensis]AEU36428.1 hypothetical protein AciX8_2099 [Granulicella mallensis MP5ACTX8]
MRPSSITTLLAIHLGLVVTLASAQKSPAPHPVAATTATDHDTNLPVTHVSLYKNGVGFFEHTGRVTGNAAVTIDFTTAQLNDVLQSLTAIDLNGGRISGAGYNSTTPLDQQLKSLPLALGTDATAADFYTAIRGARIEVNASGTSITGRLLSMEIRSVPEKNDNDSKPSIDHYFLTVVSDTGEVRTLELTSTSSVHLLDTALHQDVSRYLELLAGSRSQGLRHLTLDDRGTGTRELRVSYISEVPIWKSTYRILFTDSANAGTAQKATLQGWAVVDNTVGTDWVNVQLSLIAGSPQSFIQPLSDPIYSRRPEIPIAQEAQLTPQTFDSSIEVAKEGQPLENTPVASDTVEVSATSQLQVTKSKVRRGGIVAGMVAAPLPPSSRSYEEAASASLTANTNTAAFDDFFEYKLADPITIRKNESALVPILQAKVDADRVTLVSSNGNRLSQPLRALWITNTSGLTLDRGSFSIVEDGSFGGEGLLDPIHAGEKRLLSYAADQAVHVTTESRHDSTHITQISAAKGVLNIHHADVSEVTYVIHNAAADRRTVVLEHPVVKGFTLDSDPKPTETTPTVYRFRVEAASGETVRLHVGGKHEGYTAYQLLRSDDNQFALILNSADHNPALEQALQPILEARRHVADAQTAVDQANAKLTSLHSDEERQRANITALQNADKGSRDRFVGDLNKTEDAIAAGQKELETRTAALDAAQADLANRIEAFQFQETL